MIKRINNNSREKHEENEAVRDEEEKDVIKIKKRKQITEKELDKIDHKKKNTKKIDNDKIVFERN